LVVLNAFSLLSRTVEVQNNDQRGFCTRKGEDSPKSPD